MNDLSHASSVTLDGCHGPYPAMSLILIFLDHSGPITTRRQAKKAEEDSAYQKSMEEYKKKREEMRVRREEHAAKMV